MRGGADRGGNVKKLRVVGEMVCLVGPIGAQVETARIPIVDAPAGFTVRTAPIVGAEWARCDPNDHRIPLLAIVACRMGQR